MGDEAVARQRAGTRFLDAVHHPECGANLCELGLHPRRLVERGDRQAPPDGRSLLEPEQRLHPGARLPSRRGRPISLGRNIKRIHWLPKLNNCVPPTLPERPEGHQPDPLTSDAPHGDAAAVPVAKAKPGGIDPLAGHPRDGAPRQRLLGMAGDPWIAKNVIGRAKRQCGLDGEQQHLVPLLRIRHRRLPRLVNLSRRGCGRAPDLLY